jgi:hypothetical protein
MESTLTWQQLRDLRIADLKEAAEGWATLSRQSDAAREQVDARVSGPLAKTQESEAAEAAVKRLHRLSENYHYIHAESGLIRGTLEALTSELATQRAELMGAIEEAAGRGFTINANGSVIYPAGGMNELTKEPVPGGTAYGNDGRFDSSTPSPGSGSQGVYVPGLGDDGKKFQSPNPHLAQANEIANRLAMAVSRAREIDARYCATLEKLKAKPGLEVNTRTWADVGSDIDAVSAAASRYLMDHIPFDGSPADRKEWWDHLSAEERNEYLTAFPEVIGNLDGIPAAVRDEVNRENIDVLIAQLEGRDDERSQAQLEGLKGIRDKLHEVSVPPMFLLGVGDEGNGRAIISYGNPDTSRHVSAYVPGLGTTLDGDFADSTVRRAEQTAKGAGIYDPSVASIVWLGYDAPGFSNVASPACAQDGAPAYQSFMEGVMATNKHDDPHVTAIGHSYGSLLVGTAARDGGIPGADDIVLLGSPGTGAQTADELNVGKDHVYAASADNDPVSWLPPKESLSGPAAPFLDIPEDSRWFGQDPVSREFGAVRLESGDGPLPLLSGEGPTPAHSGYFDPTVNPSAAKNIAKIVAGRPELITMEEPR